MGKQSWVIGLFVALFGWVSSPAGAVDWLDLLSGLSPGMEAHSGSRLSEEEVRKLEEKLSRNPGDLKARARVLGYYFLRRFDSEETRKARAKHVLHVIEHHPASALAGGPYAQLDPPTHEEEYAEGRRLWLRHAAEQSTNTKVLANAAAYFLIYEPKRAEELITRARAISPSDTSLAALQGQLYALHLDGSRLEKAPEKALAAFEEATSGTGNIFMKELYLNQAAEAAFEAGEYEKARQLANELLEMTKRVFPALSPIQPHEDSKHTAYILLGRLALRDGETSAAKEYLLKGGRVGSAPTLSSFGPNMALAKELLERGEREVVLQYFDLCSRFWENPKLKQWAEEVRQGKIPDFGANLNY